MDAATVAGVIAGAISPFVARYVPLRGDAMTIAVWVGSFAVAAIAVVATQGTSGWSWSKLAQEFAVLYAVQQGVYAALKERARL